LGDVGKKENEGLICADSLPDNVKNMKDDNKIKVLFETSVLSSGHSARGIGTYARLLLENLEEFEDIEIYKSSTLSKSEKIKPNIIHYPFFDLFFNTLPINPFKNLVVTVHDVIPLIFPEFYKPGIKGRLRYNKQKIALKRAAAVITDSKASKADITKYLKIKPEKIHVVYLAANHNLKAQDNDLIQKVKQKNNLPNKYILYVGDINYNKNIPQLIKMMKYIEDESIKLVCIGRNFTPHDIPEWKWIETQLALSNVEDKVIFLNNVLTESIDELSAIYSGAEVYIQPSLYEGFGLPVLEAMQCRTPVVCSNNSSLIEVGGEYVVYSEPTGEDFAKRVNEVLNWSKTKRENWVRDAYKWSQNFSWKRTAQETAVVYRSVLKKN
jgi:glycosyltransferase involved in cell wall biosynthesis